jgi:hypothetical protein
MAAVDIGRLRLRGRPEQAPKATFLIENACRTEIPDSDRLILIRRLDLGATPMRGPAAGIVRHAYEAATQGARHGGDDMAAAANCVWFASRAEAHRLLLAALLAGRRPAGWYWPLAVPGWHGQPIGQWLDEILPAALAGIGEPGLLSIVTQIVEAGKTASLLQSLASPACAGHRSAAPAPQTPDAAPEPAGAAVPGDSAEPEERDLHRSVARLRSAMSPTLRETVEALVLRIGVASKVSTALIERLVASASPSLALAPELMRELTVAYRAVLTAAPAPHGGPPGEARPPLRRRSQSISAAPAAAASVGSGTQEAAAPRPAASRGGIEAEERAADAPAAASSVPHFCPAGEEIATAAAGLWLVIPSLIHLGFREWLSRRPDLLCDDPGRVLLRRIARHHRVAADDPVLVPLGDESDLPPPPWASLWRAGLDRWLRRRARVSLHDLVWRTGFLRLAEDRLLVRFPLEAADIRLRRRALDVDPGWTDWLGLSVRFAFADRQAL